MPLTPLILSPALPSELLTHIIRQHQHPTTLIVCSSQAEFLQSLVADAQKSLSAAADGSQEHALSSLLSSPLYQVAIARHIRMIFVPTVSHLRACLSVFTTNDSKVPSPPETAPVRARARPLLLVYGFLALHRDTSEWGAQGISSTATGLVEAARRVGFRAVVVDPPRAVLQAEDDAGAQGTGDVARVENETEQTVLSEDVPVLSASARRAGADLDEADWTGRTVTLARVLGRWFRYRQGDWAKG